jgi:hypothetical protein
MAIENYREGCFDKIYERFHTNGRGFQKGWCSSKAGLRYLAKDDSN